MKLKENEIRQSADCGFDEVAFRENINKSPICWDHILYGRDAAREGTPLSIGHVVYNETQNKPVKFFSDLLEGQSFIDEATNKDELSFERVVISGNNFKKIRLACPEFASILSRINWVFLDDCSTYDLKVSDDTYDFLCTESVDLSSATAVALALLSALALGRSGNKRDKQLLAVCETAKKCLLHDDCLSPA